MKTPDTNEPLRSGRLLAECLTAFLENQKQYAVCELSKLAILGAVLALIISR